MTPPPRDPLLLPTHPMWTYRATCERIIDGDTFIFMVDCGFHVFTRVSVRLIGIDTPELRRDDPAGHAAKVYAEHLMPPGAAVTLRTEKDRKTFDRWLAHVTLSDGRDLATLLRWAGHGGG